MAEYGKVTKLQALTETPTVKYQDDCRHPYKSIGWLTPGKEDTVVGVVEMLRGRACKSMAEVCEFVCSCQGSYEERYHMRGKITVNFWASVYGRLLVGQAEAAIDDVFYGQLTKSVPAHLHEFIKRAPVKTLTRVCAKSIECVPEALGRAPPCSPAPGAYAPTHMPRRLTCPGP